MGDKTEPSTSRDQQDLKKLPPKEKLKILCLHGYRQNAESFKSKLGSFRKYVNKYADFVFLTAPHQAPPLEGTPEGTDISDQKSWWFNKDDGTFKGTNVNCPAIGFEKSLKLVEKIWEEDGPFQGLLGFSQGGCFAGLLCGLALKGLTTVRPKFVIISSGFQSGSLVHKNFYEEIITIPSLHIYGEKDEIIPGQMSEMLASNFQNVEILTHAGGHHFPATSQQKQTYIRFFQECLNEHLKEDLETDGKTDFMPTEKKQIKENPRNVATTTTK